MNITPDTLPTAVELAERITGHLREHFPSDPGTERDRQVFALLEETGELIGAYRRWSGQARRTGTATELHAELADVILTAHITLTVYGADLVDLRRLRSGPYRARTLARELLVLHCAAGRVASAHLETTGNQQTPECARVLLVNAVVDLLDNARHVAGFLGVDPDQACRDKAGAIFSRGWKDPR